MREQSVLTFGVTFRNVNICIIFIRLVLPLSLCHQFVWKYLIEMPETPITLHSTTFLESRHTFIKPNISFAKRLLTVLQTATELQIAINLYFQSL